MNNKFAGFWKRFLMFIVDIALIGLIYVLTKMAGIHYITPIDYVYASGMLRVLVIIIPALYVVGFWAILGGTPGKLLFKTRIVDAKTGNKPSILNLIIRFICYPVSKVLVGLGFIWIGMDSRKQGWHDKVAGTVVVKKSTHPEIASIPTEKDISKWKVGKILFVISIVLFISLYSLINIDVPLTEGAKSWLSELDYNEENPEDNGYYHFIAMGVSENQNAYQAGYDYTQKENERILESNLEFGGNQDELAVVEMKFDAAEVADINQSDEIYNYCKTNKKKLRPYINTTGLGKRDTIELWKNQISRTL